METLEFEIRGFKHFNYSGIRRLVWKPETPIQVILGTNGSGKSRLTKELLLATAKRDNYSPIDGYYKHTIRHNGSVFVIGSDFSKKASPHFFFKDDVSLNESGNTGVQDDLLREHFGITPIKAAVLSGRLNLAEMTGAGRKTFFMTASPYQLEYILDQHKKVASAARACKNNLSHLTERKLALETELLSTEFLEKSRQEMASINEQIAALIGHAHNVDARRRVVDTKLAEATKAGASLVDGITVSQYISDQTKVIKDLQNALIGTADVPRSNPEEYLQLLQTEYARAEERKNGIERKYNDLDREMTRLKENVTEIERTRQIGDIDQEIARLSRRIIEIESDPEFRDDVFDASSMESVREVLPILQDIFSRLVDLRYPLVPYAHLQQERDTLQANSDAVSRNLALLDSLQEEAERLNRSITISRQDVPDSPCAKEACPLFREFSSLHERNKEKYAHLTARIRELKTSISASQRYIDDHADRVNHLWAYVPVVQELLQYLNGTKCLRDLFVKEDILKLISSSPASMLERVNDKYRSSYVYHSIYVPTKEDLSARLKEKAASEQLSVGEVDLLRALLAEKEEEARRTRSDLYSAATQCITINERVNSARRYIDTCRRAREIIDDLQLTELRATLEHERFQLEELAVTIKAEKDARITEMARIQGVISKQEALRARYSDEVVYQIQEVSQKRSELLEIERSLSPTNGIPHIYSITFINEVIDIVNEYIEAMWGYPFGLVPLDPSKPLDYDQFAVFVGESVTPDMSECSDAQIEMLNLALTLALRIVLNLTDYPLHLDEIGRSFDPHHKQQLLHLLRRVVDNGDCSQLFLINHHAVIHEGLVHHQVLVLSEANILRPPTYNQHVEIERK